MGQGFRRSELYFRTTFFPLRRGYAGHFFESSIKGGLGIEASLKGDAQDAQVSMFFRKQQFLGQGYPVSIDELVEVLTVPII